MLHDVSGDHAQLNNDTTLSSSSSVGLAASFRLCSAGSVGMGKAAVAGVGFRPSDLGFGFSVRDQGSWISGRRPACCSLQT